MNKLMDLILSAEVPAPIPGWPGWVEKVTVVGLIVMFGLALARNWLYTSGQVDKLLEAERRVGDLWRQNAETQAANMEKILSILEPVQSGNEAILRAVEQVQREQMAQRYRDRDQGGR